MFSVLLGRRPKPDDKAQDKAQPAKEAMAAEPPLLPEEQNGNLSVLEKDLNRRMVCPAGKNQVYIRSLVTSRGTSPPRIALRCVYRRELGQSPDVHLEHIRDVCCSDPGQCSAFRETQKRLADL